MRNIFLEKPSTICGRNLAQYVAESSSRPFYKKNLVDLWIDCPKCYKFVFILCPSQGPPNILKKLTTLPDCHLGTYWTIYYDIVILPSL